VEDDAAAAAAIVDLVLVVVVDVGLVVVTARTKGNKPWRQLQKPWPQRRILASSYRRNRRIIFHSNLA
jgi:hypothetical protein